MRRWTHALLVAVVLSVTAGMLPGSPAAAQVPPPPGQSSGPSSWHGGPLHDGSAPGDAVAPPLRTAWKVVLPNVDYTVVGAGRAFVLHGTPSGAAVTALDVATGTRLWGPTPSSGDASSHVAGHAYDAGRVFSVSSNGVLRALDEVDGRELWSVKLSQYSFDAPITAAFGSVYLGGGGSGGTLYAVDAATGELQWSRSVNGSRSAPVVTADRVYVAYGCGPTYAFRRTDGAPEWTRHNACSSGSGSTAHLHDGRLYVRDLSFGAVLDAATGDELGPLRTQQAPAFAGGIGFFLEGDVLTARDTRTDAVLWSTRGDGDLATPPFAVGGHVYVGGSSGLTAFRQRDGAQVWKGDVRARPADQYNVHPEYAGIAVSGSTMLVAAASTVTALRPEGEPAAPPLPVPPPVTPPAGLGSSAGPAIGTTEATAWQGGPRHAGHTPGEAFAPPLARAWQQTLRRASHAVVGDGRAFVLSGVSPPASPDSYGNELHAFDVASGERLWGPVALGGPYSLAGHAYDAGRVYTVTGDGVVRAHDAATGARLWSKTLGSSGASLVTAAFGDVHVSLAFNDRPLRVLDGATGEERWSVAGSWGSHSAPVVTEDSVYVFYGCVASAYARRDGTRRWQRTTPCAGFTTNTPALHGDRLYVREGQVTYALDTATGALTARFATGRPAAYAGDTGYFLEGGTLTARSLSTGQARWRRAGAGRLEGAPYVANGHVYVASPARIDGDWLLHAYRVSDGVEVWRAPVPADATDEHNYSQSYDGITVARGTVLVSGADTLTALRGVPAAPTDPVEQPPAPLPSLPLPSLPLPSLPVPSLPVPTPALPTASPSPSASSTPSPSPSPSPTTGPSSGPAQPPASSDGGRVAPQSRDTADACPPGEVPPAGFRDLPADGTHTPSVECLVWWGVARGRTSDTYGPALPVTRGQMATFVANAITASGGSLPQEPSDAFRDDDGSVHEGAVNRLAAVGVVAGRADGSYGPGEPVRRDAMAKFLVLAYEHRAQTLLTARGDYFADDDGTTHEVNIDKAAEAGFTGGSGDGSYRPAEVVRRDQMGSFLARVLDLSVEQAGAKPPSRR